MRTRWGTTELIVLDGTLLKEARVDRLDTTHLQPVCPSSFVQVVWFGTSCLKSGPLCSFLPYSAWKVKSGGPCL